MCFAAAICSGARRIEIGDFARAWRSRETLQLAASRHFHPPRRRYRRAGISCSQQTRTSISPIFNHFQIRKAEIGRTPCYTGV
jgi:hypothetical protein